MFWNYLLMSKSPSFGRLSLLYDAKLQIISQRAKLVKETFLARILLHTKYIMIFMEERNKYSDVITSLLSENRILDAFTYIREQDKTHSCANQLSGTDMTYKYMLEYFGKSTTGAIDPSREEVVCRTKEELHRAADILYIEDVKKVTDSQFFSMMRTLSIRPENNILKYLESVKHSCSNADLAKEAGSYTTDIQIIMERACEQLFSVVWTTVFLTKTEQTALLEFITEYESESAYNAKMLVIAALLLTSMKFYDYRKLQLLYRTVLTQTDKRIVSRALVGALLITAKYEERISNDKSITVLGEAVADNKELLTAVRKFVPAMLRTIDTERVNKHVRDDIIPEIMRAKPDIEKTLRRMGGKPDITDIEENPDWEEVLNKSGITDKLKELTEMQMDGADIFMSAFAQMKGFPFFRKLSNWLLPFDFDNSELRSIRESIPENVLKMLTAGNYFCASDKYSMTFALAGMPRAQFQMMSSQLNEQINSMKEDAATTLLGAQTDISGEIKLYLKDLYRFYRLKNDDNSDPFRKIFEMPAIEPFKTLHTDSELQRSIAEFYFRYGYWQQAFDAFRVVSELCEEASEDVLQKEGYCLQLLGRDEEALKAYRQAEILNPESDWLLKRIAILLRDLKRYEEASQYAQKALSRKPENLSLEMLRGTTQMLAGHIDEALKSFFKIRYLNPDNTKVLRPMAWCEFMRGDYEKSIRMYESLPDMSSSDILNTGHAYFAKGDIAAAQRCYKSCMNMLPGGAEDFRALMKEDAHYLREAGIQALDIALMTDLVTAT